MTVKHWALRAHRQEVFYEEDPDTTDVVPLLAEVMQWLVETNVYVAAIHLSTGEDYIEATVDHLDAPEAGEHNLKSVLDAIQAARQAGDGEAYLRVAFGGAEADEDEDEEEAPANAVDRVCPNCVHAYVGKGVYCEMFDEIILRDSVALECDLYEDGSQPVEFKPARHLHAVR